MASLPATTPQAFATYVDANLKGDNGKAGGSVAALASLGYTGATIGDQWLSFYAAKHGKFGSTYTLVQYEEAFVVLWTDATLGSNIATATGATGSIISGDLSGIGKGIAQFNNQLGGLPASISSVTQFLSGLTSGNLWVRVAKVILGGVILTVGVAKLAGVTSGTVGKAVAMAPLL